jgi:rubredoxin
VTAEADSGSWRCEGCGYVYDPAAGDEAGGVPAGTDFFELPEAWVCPVCGLGKESFTAIED